MGVEGLGAASKPPNLVPASSFRRGKVRDTVLEHSQFVYLKPLSEKSQNRLQKEPVLLMTFLYIYGLFNVLNMF